MTAPPNDTAPALVTRGRRDQEVTGHPDSSTLATEINAKHELAHQAAKTAVQYVAARSWRDVLQVHPATDMFPLLAWNELNELASDITKNGLAERIVYTGTPGAFVVLDGRNRLDALLWHNHPVVDEHGHPLPEYCEYREHVPDVTAWIISKNIRRRHLTAAQKRNLIARLIMLTPEKSNRAVAKMIGVDHKTVSAVRGDLQAGGEIPHVEKLVGSDGKAQPAKKTTASKPLAKITPQAPSATVHTADLVHRGDDDDVQLDHVDDDGNPETAKALQVERELTALFHAWDEASHEAHEQFLAVKSAEIGAIFRAWLWAG